MGNIKLNIIDFGPIGIKMSGNLLKILFQNFSSFSLFLIEKEMLFKREVIELSLFFWLNYVLQLFEKFLFLFF